MARYGKTLQDEARLSNGAEEDIFFGGQTSEDDGADRKKSLRSVGSSLVLFFSLGLFYSERWIGGLVLLFVFVGLIIVNAPRGGAFYENDNSVPPEDP